MGKFRVVVSATAKRDIAKHLKSGNRATIAKLKKILIELELHPETGTGKPEVLKYELAGLWSRRINQKDRLVYQIKGQTVTVEVLSAIGHYLDK